MIAPIEPRLLAGAKAAAYIGQTTNEMPIPTPVISRKRHNVHKLIDKAALNAPMTVIIPSI